MDAAGFKVVARQPFCRSLLEGRACKCESGACGEGKWLRMVRIIYRDICGQERSWEACERIMPANRAACDAVVIFTIIGKKSKHALQAKTLLVRQWRPAVGGWTLECPAGLMESTDSGVCECAQRELMEETGYVGRCLFVSPPLLSDPGITPSTYRYVVVRIDADDPSNLNPRANPEESEYIEVVQVALANLNEYLHLQHEAGTKIDSRLYSISMFNLINADFLEAIDVEN